MVTINGRKLLINYSSKFVSLKKIYHKKYGVDNPYQREDVKEKNKQKMRVVLFIQPVFILLASKIIKKG